MFPQGVAHQSGTVSPGALGGLVGSLQQLFIQHNLNDFHMWNLFHSILHTRETSIRGENAEWWSVWISMGKKCRRHPERSRSSGGGGISRRSLPLNRDLARLEPISAPGSPFPQPSTGLNRPNVTNDLY